MFSAADLIDVVMGRGQARFWFRAAEATPPGEFPTAWKAWFAMMGERVGAVTGATAEAIVAIFLQRELAMPPRRAGELNRWQSFATLWRQQWQPPEQEERRTRLLAIAITFVVHLLLVLILLWLAYVRFVGAPAPQGEEVVQVEYVGQGTPKLEGGGPSAGETSTPAAAASAVARPVARPTPTPPQPQSAQSSPPAPATPSEPPQPPSPTPAGAQPLQVTEKPVPDTTFVLPSPTPLRVEVPQAQVTVPKLQVPTRDVELVETPPLVQAIKPQLPSTVSTALQPKPQPQPQPIPVGIATPLPKVQPREVAIRPVAAPVLQTKALPMQVHEAPTSTPAPAATSPATATTTSATPATGNTPAGAALRSGGPPSTRSGTQPTATASGSGPASTPKPGAWPTPQRGDDWGASTRNRPGGNTGKQPGLLNADGTPRLASGTAAAGGGFPPGSDHWTRDLFDRAGTWLKRPPNGYTPTRFDKVWIPNETLLEQWVRQNIREVSIPIPGTSKKLRCVVSLLQLGGGCAISDPNLNDQEATARPPPDVPFKPELQEDQKSLRKPGSP
jgi:hypothetical protein